MSYIPEISAERVAELQRGIRPLVRRENRLHEIDVPDAWKVAFTWSPVLRGIVDESSLEVLEEVHTYHAAGHIALVKPSIAEVLAQMPERLVGKAIAFETCTETAQCVSNEAFYGHQIKTVFYGAASSARNAKPLFQHDCGHCHYLGTYRDEAGRMSDLWVHLTGALPTVIARYSSEGPDYTSGMSFSYGLNAALTEARRRAEQRGLREYNTWEALNYVSDKDATAVAELLEKIPAMAEYQCVAAFEAGHVQRYRYLLQVLIDASKQREEAMGRPVSRGFALMQVENRLCKVLTRYRGIDTLAAYEVITLLTEAAWEALPPTEFSEDA